MKDRASSKPCRQMGGSEFTRHVLENFDLDIARHAIYANNYISCSGGVDTIVTYFDDKWERCVLYDIICESLTAWLLALSNRTQQPEGCAYRFMELDTLVWSDRSWRPMNEAEKQLKRADTRARVEKYVARCLNHVLSAILLNTCYQAGLSPLQSVHQASWRNQCGGVLPGYPPIWLLWLDLWVGLTIRLLLWLCVWFDF